MSDLRTKCIEAMATTYALSWDDCPDVLDAVAGVIESENPDNWETQHLVGLLMGEPVCGCHQPGDTKNG